MRFERLADWLSWQEGLHPRPIDLGLDRCRMVASRVGIGAGDSVVITVTGTNGKGSCVAYLEAMSRAAGYSVGAYLSPPLEGLNESIRINGENASDEQLARAFDLVDRARGGVSLTAFEFRTLAALRLFAEMRPQLLLLEIGMGGARDAVNVLDSDIAVFTTLDVDHTGWLGPDRNSIAREKAGILRADRPAVCGDPDPPPSLLACAKSVRSPLRVAGRDFRYEIEGERWSWTGWANHHSNLPSPGIRGRCQYDNATTALAAIEHLPPALRPGTAEIRDGGRHRRPYRPTAAL